MSPKFHERFEISIDIEDAMKRFVNRIGNRVFDDLFETSAYKSDLLKAVANGLGEWYIRALRFEAYTGRNFYKTLQAIEAARENLGAADQLRLDALVERTLRDAEVDLGVGYEKGTFLRSGAKLLDEKLINETLRWLSDGQHESVLKPFSKGLEHFLRAGKSPELLSDVVTDMYEALEALSKIVTNRDRDLSANAELFLKKLGVSEAYKKLLKEYVSYANKFRHAADSNAPKPSLSIAEVESFMYLTGVFIRLAIQAT